MVLPNFRKLIIDSDCINILICGDLNCHFSRGTRFTQIVSDFFEELELVIFWSNPENNIHHNIEQVQYTWRGIRDDKISLSTVDHFVGNKRVFDAVLEAGVIHDHGANLSDHSPIYTKLKVGHLDVSTEKKINKKSS